MKGIKGSDATYLFCRSREFRTSLRRRRVTAVKSASTDWTSRHRRLDVQRQKVGRHVMLVVLRERGSRGRRLDARSRVSGRYKRRSVRGSELLTAGRRARTAAQQEGNRATCRSAASDTGGRTWADGEFDAGDEARTAHRRLPRATRLGFAAWRRGARHRRSVA